MTEKILLLIGILFNVIGLAILFFAERPIANEKPGTFLFTDSELSEKEKEFEIKKKHYQMLKTGGFIVNLLGLFFQIFALVF